ncbi:MAG: hypothetical protein Q8K60_05090 [Parachlamydiaceae bacterium]|nr:hypothetical protein [Parachlamydiaceae bacterium]
MRLNNILRSNDCYKMVINQLNSNWICNGVDRAVIYLDKVPFKDKPILNISINITILCLGAIGTGICLSIFTFSACRLVLRCYSLISKKNNTLKISPPKQLLKEIIQERQEIFPNLWKVPKNDEQFDKKQFSNLNQNENFINVLNLYGVSNNDERFTEDELNLIDINEEWNVYMLMHDLIYDDRINIDRLVQYEEYREKLKKIQYFSDQISLCVDFISMETNVGNEEVKNSLIINQENLKRNLIKNMECDILGVESMELLPPEKLICAVLDSVKSKKDFVNEITNKFLRDCAYQYFNVAKIILENQFFWENFKCDREYILDIVDKYPELALKIILSECGNSFENDNSNLSFDLFNYAYPFLKENISSIVSSKIEFAFLIKYLLNLPIQNRLSIRSSDLEKVINLSNILQQLPNKNKNQIRMIQSVIGRLSLPGVYGEEISISESIDQSMINVFEIEHFVFEEDEIYEKIMAIKTNEKNKNIKEAFFYLSSIGENSPSYCQVQMLLGRMWSDQKEFLEAGKCFLKVINYKKEINNINEKNNIVWDELNELKYAQKQPSFNNINDIYMIYTDNLELKNELKNKVNEHGIEIEEKINEKNKILNLISKEIEAPLNLIREAIGLAAINLLMNDKNVIVAKTDSSTKENDLSFEQMTNFMNNENAFISQLKISYQENKDFINFLNELDQIKFSNEI